MLVNVCLDIFRMFEPFVAKPGVLMHHHELECFTKRLLSSSLRSK